MSNARSLVADPAASTEIKILNGTSLAVTRMPQRNANCISVDFQDAPRLDFQERIIVKDICDFVITLLSNHLKDSAGLVISVPTAIKILNGMSSAVTEVPRPIVNSFFVHLQDLNLPRLGSQGKTTVKDICDSVMTLRNNRQDDFARYEQLLRLVNDMHAIKSVRYSTYTDEEKFWSFADELGT